MNTTILRVQLWELWRLTWLDLLFRIGGTLAYLWLFTWMPEGVTDYLQGIVLIVVIAASLVSGLWLTSYDRRSQGGFPFALGYTRPILTRWLVAVPLAWLFISNALIFLALTCAAELAYAWSIPQLSMLPVILTGTALVAVVSWCTTGQAERETAATIVGTVALGLVIVAADLLDPLTEGAGVGVVFYAPSLLASAVLLAGTLLAIYLCIVGIRLIRSGGRASLLGGRSLFQGSSRGGVEQVEAFRSARHAQWWFDVRRSGNRARAIVLNGLAVMLLASWGATEFGAESIMAILWAASVVIAPLALLGVTVNGVLGLKYNGADSRLAIYEAIRPVTVSQNIRQKLALILAITLPGWAVIALGASVSAVLLNPGLLRDLSQSLSPSSNLFLLRAAGAIGGVSLLATATCIAFALLLMSAGYVAPRLKEHPVACWVFAVAVAVSLALPVAEALTGWKLAGIARACQILWGAFFIGSTAWSLWRARRERLYSLPWLCCAAGAWALLLAALAGAARYAGAELPDLTPYTTVLVVGLLTIPLASVAWAPLSLAALRHQ